MAVCFSSLRWTVRFVSLEYGRDWSSGGLCMNKVHFVNYAINATIKKYIYVYDIDGKITV